MTSFDFLVREHDDLPCKSAPDLFFEAEKDEPDGLSTNMKFRLAKKLCDACPIRRECLHHAIVNNIQHGVWGQTTPLERSYIKKA